MEKNVLGKMRKLLYSAGLMMFSTMVMPVCVEAAEERALEAGDFVDNDALFAQYLDQLMYPEGDITMAPGDEENAVFRSGSARNALTKYGKTAYDYLKEQLELVANGESDSTEFHIPYNAVYGADESFTFSASELGLDRITEENYGATLTAIYDLMQNGKEPGLGDVFDAIGADVPYLMYWAVGSGISVEYPDLESVSYTDDSITVKPRDNGSFQFSFAVYEKYRADTLYKVDTAKTSAAKRAVDHAKEIAGQAASMTDMEKLNYFKGAICDLVSYAYGSNTAVDYDPWQIVYVFDQDPSTKAVCEGYSKAFKYLCDLTTFSSEEIECRLAAGYLETGSDAPGEHMWNIVQLHKDENYLVDVTNCDDDMLGAPDLFFMCNGSERVSKTINGNECWGYRIAHPSESVFYYYDNSRYNKMRSESELVLMEEGAGARAFVSRLYAVGLGREPEEEGLNQWTSQLMSGEKKAVDVVQGVLCSPEYLNKGKTNGEMVTDCYNAMLGRNPDQEGFDNWVARLDSGMSINAIFAGFVGSPEFGALCGRYEITPGEFPITEARDKNAGVTMFVSRLYTEALGRAYDIDGLNTWCGRINSDPTRSNILNVATDGFFHSQEFLNKGLDNNSFVTVLYHTYLGRNPDEAGHATWVGLLDRGEKTRDEVMEGFAYSDEFGQIMASYGL